MADLNDPITIPVDSSQMITAIKISGNLVTALNNTQATIKRFTQAELDMAQAGVQGFNQMGSAVDRLQNTLINHAKVTDNAAKSNSKFGMYAQQVGYQVGDFFVQVQSGTNALLAFGQQGTQLAGLLPGIAGAIVGIGLAIGTAIGGSLLRSKTSFKDIENFFGSMGPVVATLADVFIKVGNVVVETLNLIVNNLDRVLAYATAAAIYFGGPFVAAMVASALSIEGFSAALLFLRGALIRTGVGALIIGAGELIYQFTKLVEGAGSFGQAMAILSDISSETFNRIKIIFDIVVKTIQAGSLSMSSYFLKELASMGASFVAFSQNVAEGFNGLFGTNLEGPSQEPFSMMAVSAVQMGDAAKAANEQISSLGSQLTAPMESVNALTAAMKKADKEGKQIDIADWFGGSGKKKKGGASDATIENKLKGLYDYLGAQKQIEAYLISEEDIAYQQREDLLKTALDRKLITIQEYQQMERDLTLKHQEELANIERMRQTTQIKDAGTFFGGMADLAKAGGDKTAKAVRVFSAAQALTNSYLAFTQILADPSLIGRPWARFGMAASALASGLSAVAAIKSGGGGSISSGGSSSGKNPASVETSSSAQTASPQVVMIQGLKPTDVFTGEQLSTLFDSLYKENRNRGMVFQVAR